ncbi:hypothetical protein ABZZ04_24835 [Streptomyces sp. NPDC006435]|uniref:hypothetical protein n=1 Tax=Streptomyces sp. NPDC006435 TaxID=3154300 RepID=UPI0033A047F3
MRPLLLLLLTAAVKHLRVDGSDVRDEDVARLSPFVVSGSHPPGLPVTAPDAAATIRSAR